MVTRISDIIEPVTFTEYMIRRTSELSRLVQSGLMQRSGEFDTLASGAGRSFTMPFWSDLTGTSEELADDAALTVSKIAAASDVATKHLRGKAWGVNDLSKYTSGSDPAMAIGDLMAAFWERDMQKTILIPTLKGVFATALASTHVLDKTVSDNLQASVTDTNLIGTSNFIAAAGLLGDAWQQITAICIHSVPFQRLQTLDLIETEHLQDQNIDVSRFLGREVIVDDGMPTTAITGGFEYTTYLFGPGAIALGEGGPDPEEAIEYDRDILAGDNIITSRRHFIMHPRGVAWVGTSAGDSPTAAELAVGTNWSRRYEVKQVPMVALMTNG